MLSREAVAPCASPDAIAACAHRAMLPAASGGHALLVRIVHAVRMIPRPAFLAREPLQC